MSDIERRGGSRLTRQAARASAPTSSCWPRGAFGLIGVAGILLAILGIFGAGWPILSLIIAAICFMLLRRTVR